MTSLTGTRWFAHNGLPGGGWRRSRAQLGLAGFLLLATLSLPFAASAAKPAPKPAPTCSSGVLGTPAFAFLWSFQLYVGNADGSCAVALASVAQQYPVAFAFDGTKYRVAWMADTRDEVKLISRMRWTIKMVEFTMSNGNIRESRPLQVRELWRDSVTTSDSTLSSPGIDSNARRLVFTRTYAGVTEVKQLDLTSCTPTCAPPTVLLAPIYNPIGVQFGRAGNDRLYYLQKTTNGMWWELGFFENSSGALSGPIVIVDSTHPRYIGTRAGGERVGGLFRGNFSPDDLVAFAWVSVSGADVSMDVIQVGAGCVAGLPSSCLASGNASLIAQDVPEGPYASSAEWTSSGYLLREVQAPDGTKRIETIDPVSPPVVLVDHGIGGLPAGLKQ
jgi:hypothetical protein